MKIRCPYCREKATWKMQNPHWVRFTPGDMRNMRCSTCGKEFIKWHGFIPLSHGTARALVGIWHWAVAALLLIGSALTLSFLLWK